MAEEQKTGAQQPIPWVPSEEGIYEIYCNFTNVNWTLYDVRFRLAQLIPAKHGSGMVAEERAAVTFAWPHAKILRDLLTDLVARYEQANGEIKPLILPKGE